MIKKKALIRYILLQIPGLILLILALVILSQLINIQTWLLTTIIILWIAKDIALFPKLWKSYDTNSPTPMEKLIGLNGIATDHLNPVGYVKVRGELWKAEISDSQFPAEKGDTIKVVDVRGMLLIVKRRNNT